MTEITLQEQLSDANAMVSNLHYLIQSGADYNSDWISEVLFDILKMVTNESINNNLRKFIRDAHKEAIVYIEHTTDICLDEYYRLVKEFNEGLNE